MGGAVKKVTNAFKRPANIAGSVFGSVPGIGPVLGPAASIALGGNPITAIAGGIGNALTGRNSGGGGGGGIVGNYGTVGLVGSGRGRGGGILDAARTRGFGNSGGGGTQQPTPPVYGSTVPEAAGSGITAPFYLPTYNYEANSYTVDNNPYDTSKYFIEGNKGTYNVLPQLANLYDPTTQQRAGAPSANIYNDIIGQFSQNQDSLAQQNFQKNFGLQTYNPNTASPTTLDSDFNVPDYLRSDIQNALGEYYPSGTTQTDSIPVNYADFGFKQGDTLQNIANYAKQQNNPFFMPYAPQDVRPEPEPYRAPTIMPVSSNPQVAQSLRYAPSQDARGPAPRDLAPASVASSGSFRPAEVGSTTATQAPQQQPAGGFKPVNIRTGGLASLRRK